MTAEYTGWMRSLSRRVAPGLLVVALLTVCHDCSAFMLGRFYDAFAHLGVEHVWARPFHLELVRFAGGSLEAEPNASWIVADGSECNGPIDLSRCSSIARIELTGNSTWVVASLKGSEGARAEVVIVDTDKCDDAVIAAVTGPWQPRAVNLTAKHFKVSAAAWLRLVAVEHLMLFWETTPPDLTVISTLPLLKSLMLSSKGLVPESLACLGNARKLQKLICYGLDDACVAQLGELDQLAELELSLSSSGKGLGPLSQQRECFRGLRALEVHAYVEDGAKDGPTLALHNQAVLCRLEHLAIAGSRLSARNLPAAGQACALRSFYCDSTVLSDGVLAGLGALTSLECLDLCCVERGRSEELAQACRAPKLDCLVLRSCPWVKESVLVDILSTRQWRCVSLEGIERVSGEVFGALANCPFLRALRVANCRSVDDAGFKALCAKKKVMRLSIEQCASISADALGAIALLKDLRWLQVGDVAAWGDNELRSVCTARLPLEYLEVSNSLVGTAVLCEALDVLPLRELRVYAHDCSIDVDALRLKIKREKLAVVLYEW